MNRRVGGTTHGDKKIGNKFRLATAATSSLARGPESAAERPVQVVATKALAGNEERIENGWV